MRTVQITLDDDLVAELDRLAKEDNTDPSVFTADALRLALKHHRKQQQLAAKNESAHWEDEQAWMG